MINLRNSDIKITAGLRSQFPNDQRPQIVFSGRSNVGKSSLINALLDRKSLARVSSAPGKTITVNFYDIDGKIWFVDLPGYGFAKRAPEDKARWSALTEGFITDVRDDRLVLQLIDMKVGPTNDDLMMLDWLKNAGQRFVVVATKSDKLNKTDYAKQLKSLSSLADTVIPFSALSKAGRDEIRDVIFNFAKG
ncbi:MAG: YihA family ribosome biogenesis GTP-binding protein [Firmicutes bacterium]|nr:YihA family ribosome biogenesis GTP-binding protein [Candidatus Colimorpha enterica]